MIIDASEMSANELVQTPKVFMSKAIFPIFSAGKNLVTFKYSPVQNPVEIVILPASHTEMYNFNFIAGKRDIYYRVDLSVTQQNSLFTVGLILEYYPLV